MLLLLLSWGDGLAAQAILILQEGSVPRSCQGQARGSGAAGAAQPEAEPAAALQSGKCVYFWDIGFPAGRPATAKVFIGSQ